MTDIGTLAISMGLDIAELRKDSARAKKDIKDMSSAMERDINRVNKNFERMSDRFSKDISQLKRSVASLEQQMDKMAKSTERSFDRTNKAVKKSSSAFNGFVKTVRAAALGYATVLATMEITQFTSGILKQGVALDSLQRSYKAITGSAEESNRILNMLGKTANDLGLNLNAVEDSYRNILAASKNTALEGQAIEKVFMSVVKASAVLGMSADDTAGTLRALSQMISKGNVQAEELRGQLGERLPGAFQMAAEAMGVSTQQLNKMLEQGQVLASDLIPRLADVLENRFGEASKEAGKRAGASFARLSNSVIQLQRTLATSGILDLFVELADSISSLLNDSQDDIEEFMESLNFEDGIENVLALASAFGKLYKVITFGGGIGEFAGYVNALTDEFFTMLDGAKALAQGQITWDEFLGSGNEINSAVDRWKEGEKAVLAFRDAVEEAKEADVDFGDTAGLGVMKWTESLSTELAKGDEKLKTTQSNIETLAKAFDKPKEAIQSLQKELKELQDSLSIGAHGIQIVTPELSADLAKIKELQKDLEILQELVAYNYEVETLKRLGDTLGYVQQKTNEAVKAQEEFQDMLNASPYDPNMGEFDFESKTRDAALKRLESQKKMLDDFVNYSKSKYDEECENVNETFRQLYIIYKDNAEKREQLREALAKRLVEIDKEELKSFKATLKEKEEAYSKHIKEQIETMNDLIEKEKEWSEDLAEYKDSELSPRQNYKKELADAKKTYKEMLGFAEKLGDDKGAVERAYQRIVAKLRKDETDRQKKEYDDQLKAKQELNKKMYATDIALANLVEDDMWLLRDKGLKEAEKQHEDTQTKITEAEWKEIQKRAADKIKAEKEAAAEIEKEWKRVYDDMHKFAADTFYDIFDGQLDSFEDFADSMLDIFKRMLANMAAEAAMTNIFKPMMNQMAGSTIGNILGLPSLAGGGGTTMFPSFSGMSNLPGMGWLGATIPGSTNLAMTTAGASQGMLYPGAINGPAPAGFGGVTWGSALGAGALGSLGYSTLGSAIGLPTSGYSGITSGLGAAGMSAYGGSLASLTGIGALGGPIGIGLGALAGGLLGGLFGGGSDPAPALGIQGGLSSAPGRNPADFYDSRFFNWTVFEQDLSADAAIAIRDHFDNYFLQIDEAIEGALKETFNKYDPGAVNRGWVYTEGLDEGQIVNGISDTVFKSVLEGLKAESLGAGFDAFDTGFFESIKTEGQDLFQAYVGFYDVVSNTQNFLEDFTRRVDSLGQTSVEAYQQIQLVSGVLAEMDMAIAQITGSAVIGQINALSDTWNAYIDVMKQAQATAEQLTDAESKRNLVVGSQITGITTSSIAQALKSGSSVDAIVSKAMGDLVAEKMAQEMFDEMVPVVEEAGRVWEETGGNIDAVTDYLRSMGYQFEDTMSVFSDSMESARDALDAAIGKEEQLINARLDAADKIDTLLVDLMGGSQAPVQSMEFFERRYEQLLAEAQGATTAEEINSSVDALTGFVSQYLDFAGDYGGQDYNSLFNKITSDLKDIEYEQRSEAEKQISKLEEINSTLGIVADAALSLETAFSNFLSAQSDFLSAQSEVGQAGFNEAKYMQNKVDQLNQIGFEGKSWDLASTYAAFDRAGLTPLEHYLRYGKDEGLMPFADGGISTGPASGYPIMAHNTEAHVPIKNGSIPVEISRPGTIPNINLKIFIGNKEIKDFQVEVINTDPEAQRAIRRVANG